MKSYSNFIETIYDQDVPVGEIGRGTHYSVLRAIVWHVSPGNSLSRAEYHDFAVIWDEDHDERVMEVIHEMHAQNLLFACKFIGEKKGNLTVIIHDEAYPFIGVISKMIEKIAQNSTDPWGSEVFIQEEGGMALIADNASIIATYLQNIDNLHHLGNKPIVT